MVDRRILLSGLAAGIAAASTTGARASEQSHVESLIAAHRKAIEAYHAIQDELDRALEGFEVPEARVRVGYILGADGKRPRWAYCEEDINSHIDGFVRVAWSDVQRQHYERKRQEFLAELRPKLAEKTRLEDEAGITALEAESNAAFDVVVGAMSAWCQAPVNTIADARAKAAYALELEKSNWWSFYDDGDGTGGALDIMRSIAQS